MKLTAENQKKAGATGGIEAVVKVIITHVNNANICEKGCNALRNMTDNNSRCNVKIWWKTNEQLKIK